MILISLFEIFLSTMNILTKKMKFTFGLVEETKFVSYESNLKNKITRIFYPTDLRHGKNDLIFSSDEIVFTLYWQTFVLCRVFKIKKYDEEKGIRRWLKKILLLSMIMQITQVF
jgi:hypothetical protein